MVVCPLTSGVFSRRLGLADDGQISSGISRAFTTNYLLK